MTRLVCLLGVSHIIPGLHISRDLISLNGTASRCLQGAPHTGGPQISADEQVKHTQHHHYCTRSMCSAHNQERWPAFQNPMALPGKTSKDQPTWGLAVTNPGTMPSSSENLSWWRPETQAGGGGKSGERGGPAGPSYHGLLWDLE